MTEQLATSHHTHDHDQIETRLETLGLTLPIASDPQGSYCNCVRTGNLLYVSGKGPMAG
ncbi:hypothetical protein [Vibrio mexicanus]|uniref:hypothetical protein n=1 Tax=Vibrio mexicanus TaxID=1004326 RepID=UPI000A75E9B4|nr:hypothetical protein [Vibrio mexicanus]